MIAFITAKIRRMAFLSLYCSISRHGGSEDGLLRNFVKCERSINIFFRPMTLTRYGRADAPSFFGDTEPIWNWMALAQHHGAYRVEEYERGLG